MSAETRQKSADSPTTLGEDARSTFERLTKQAKQNSSIRQFDAKDVEAACKYLAARIHQSPCLPSRIADEFDVDEDEMLSISRRITLELEINIPPAQPQSYVEQFCDELELDSAKSVASEILSEFKNQNGISGSPTSIAAGAVYAATRTDCPDSITQSTLSDVAGVSEVTIRSRYEEMLETYNDQRQSD